MKKKERKDQLIPVDITAWPERNPKHYTYAYMQGTTIKYVGKGSDGNQSKKKRFGRAKDILKGHNIHCSSNIDTITSIRIIGGFDEADKCTMNEAAHIKFFNLLDLKVGWNLRDEMRDPKFYAMLEAIDGIVDMDIPTLIYYMKQNATGSSTTENEKLATDLLQHVNFDHRKVVLVGNNGYGGYNFLKNLVEMQDNAPREISLIISQNFLVSIGINGMMNNRALKVQTGIKNFLDDNFRETGNVFIFNPPFKEGGIKFIEKAASLMQPGDKMVCIMATDMFSPMPLDEIGQPGTFSWMNKRGNFERIELYRSSKVGKTPPERITFKDITGTCWFVWEKGLDREQETTITNTLGETFQYLLKGEETKIPMEPWENIKDYVNWNEDEALHFYQTEGDTPVGPETKLRFKLFTTGVGYKDLDNENESGRRSRIIVKNDPNYILDKVKFFNFIAPDLDTGSRNKTLYSKKMDTVINHYPLDKEYFRLRV